MKIGFISPFVPGHLNPMTTLARQLQARSHDVVYISPPELEPVIRAYGLPFVPFGGKESPSVVSAIFKTRLAQLSKLQG